EIVGGLPPSAYDHQAWWSNSTSHPLAAEWLRAGWRSVSPNLTAQRIRLERAPIAEPEATPAGTFNRPGTVLVESGAAEFKRAFFSGDSAFTPGTSIWTPENLESLVTNFVNVPRVADAGFHD